MIFVQFGCFYMTRPAKKLSPYRKTKRLKAHERRPLIVKAAQSILLSQGFAALTLRNTAEAADVRMATLQYYFPNRELLFQSAFQCVADKAWAEVIEQLEGTKGASPELRLRCFLQGICATSTNAELVGFFIELWAAARVHDYAAEIMQSYYTDVVTLLTKLTREANPVHTAKESRQRAIIVISMIEGLTLFKQMDGRVKRRPKVPNSKVLEAMMTMLG